MEPTLATYLKKHKIFYVEHKHPAVFTVEEANNLELNIPNIFHTKNLFLKDKCKNFFLVSMNANKRLNLISLCKKLKCKKKLSFGSAEQLKKHLNLTPGSVSIFGMINGKKVTLLLDKEVWKAKRVGFHPNINTSTLELTHKNLKKFYDSLKAKKMILELL
jgi:Ala-tRNA(Pro) deacylase